MLIEQCTVSRKTPLDGKLEISAAAAARLAALGASFSLESEGRDASARLIELTCNCAKGGAAGAHVHHFVESEALRALRPGAAVRLQLHTAHPGSLSVEPA